MVTGGGSGIGKAIVEGLSAAGVTCHAVGRRGPVKVDGTDQPAVKAFLETLDRIAILVCAAGDNVPRRSFEEITPEAWDHLLAVNLSGAFYFINAALAKLRAAQGDVLLIASFSGQWPDPSGAAYQASKAGMLALARGAGLEEHLNGVRFSVINPGATNTPIMLKRPVRPPPEMLAQMLLQPLDLNRTLQQLAVPLLARGARWVLLSS